MTAAHAHAAFSQAWPAFALVAGLLLVGAAAAQENLFVAAGALVARAPGGAFTLLAGLLLVEAAITAVLNLDTAVVFMTPVLLHAARQRGVAEDAFLYGAVFMANAASLLLPGSNLTNLIVLVARARQRRHVRRARSRRAWVVSIVLTIVFVSLVFRRGVAAGEVRGSDEAPGFRPGLGTLRASSRPRHSCSSSPSRRCRSLRLAQPSRSACDSARVRSLRAANPALLLGVLGVAVLLGTVARAVDVSVLEHAGRWETAWLAAGASVLVNNLPAAVVLSVHLPAHPRALLLGLDLGPNLAVTGSLSAVLWLQVARANGARPVDRALHAARARARAGHAHGGACSSAPSDGNDRRSLRRREESRPQQDARSRSRNSRTGSPSIHVTGRQVVLHEEPAGLEQLEKLLPVVAAAVREHEPERTSPAEQLVGVALERLDIRKAREPLTRNRSALPIALDGHDRARGLCDRSGAVSERSPELGHVTSRGEHA